MTTTKGDYKKEKQLWKNVRWEKPD
jgi:hypothetical protein